MCSTSPLLSRTSQIVPMPFTNGRLASATTTSPVFLHALKTWNGPSISSTRRFRPSTGS